VFLCNLALIFPLPAFQLQVLPSPHLSEDRNTANLGQTNLLLLVLAIVFKTCNFLICAILIHLHQLEQDKKGNRHIMREKITVLRPTSVWELLICHFLVDQLFYITQSDVTLTTTSLVLLSTIILALQSAQFHSM
jgi:hypothetical protein